MKQRMILASALLVLGGCYSKEPSPTEVVFPEDPTPDFGAIAVTIMAGGASVVGVTVDIAGPQDQQGFTDSSGVTFSEVLVGPYALTLSNIPDVVFFAETTKIVYVRKDETTTVSFEGVLVNLATASITVLVRVDSAVAAGIMVDITGSEQRALNTGNNGEALFSNLPAGSYTVTISGFSTGVSFTTLSQTVTLGQGENVMVPFDGFSAQGREMAVIEGYVAFDQNGNGTVDSGEGLANQKVTISSSAGERTTFTDSSGFYRFENVEFVDWTMRISNPDSTSYEFPGGLEQSVFVADYDVFRVDFLAISR